MLSTLPTLRVHDTDFYVDLRGMQFIQVDRPTNRISFEDVQDEGTHSLMLYDTVTKNAFKGTWAAFCASSTAIEVRLPPLEKLDPPTMSHLIAETMKTEEAQLRAGRRFKQLHKEWKQQAKKQKRK